MIDDLDLELRERLAGLAAAVPVEAPGSTVLVSPRIRPGRTGRRLALGGLVPLVTIVVVGTVAAGLAKLGPFAPGATDMGNGPVIAMTVDGPFELTVRSAKARYAASEPVEIEAALAYHGAGEVVISHAQGAPVPGRGNVDGPDTGGTGGPLGFGIVEPVIGDLLLGPSWAQSCERTTLMRDVPLTVPFSKSGGFSGSNPRADEYRAYFAEPTLRLEAGTWHVYAVAEFSPGDCGGEQHALRADIAIEVHGALEPSTTPALEPSPSPDPVITPVPTAYPVVSPGPIVEGGRVEDVRNDGTFELRIGTTGSVFTANEPIDVDVGLRYVGTKPSVVFGSSDPAVTFSLEQLDGPHRASGGADDVCMHTQLDRDTGAEIGFTKSGGYSTDDPDVDWIRAYLADPLLRLPAGTWRLSATLEAFVPSCDGLEHDVRASIVFVVTP